MIFFISSFKTGSSKNYAAILSEGMINIILNSNINYMSPDPGITRHNHNFLYIADGRESFRNAQEQYGDTLMKEFKIPLFIVHK